MIQPQFSATVNAKNLKAYSEAEKKQLDLVLQNLDKHFKSLDRLTLTIQGDTNHQSLSVKESKSKSQSDPTTSNKLGLFFKKHFSRQQNSEATPELSGLLLNADLKKENRVAGTMTIHFPVVYQEKNETLKQFEERLLSTVNTWLSRHIKK